MNATHDMPHLLKKERPVPRLLYPSLVVAAVSVTLVSLLGIAGITGHLPSALANGVTVANGGSSSDTAAAPMPAVAPKASATHVAKAACASCGVIESVNAIETRGSGSGVGAVLGGLAGAVIGNTMGAGNGRTAMTLIGGGAGAYAGNEIEKNGNRRTVYQTHVLMDDGSQRKISSSAPPAFAVGAKVKVVDGRIVARA